VIIGRATFDYVSRPGRRVADPCADLDTDAFSVRVVRLDGHERRNPHRHPHSQEFIFVVRGWGTLWEDGVGHRVVEGDCALVDTGVPHATIPDRGTTMELVCFFAHPDLPGNTEEITTIELNG
jgi:quercetin dioxygenase-like cupin family protein